MKKHLLFVYNLTIDKIDKTNTIELINCETYNKIALKDILFLYVKYDSFIHNVSYSIISKYEKDGFFYLTVVVNKIYQKIINFKKNKDLFKTFIKRVVSGKQLNNIDFVTLDEKDVTTLETILI